MPDNDKTAVGVNEKLPLLIRDIADIVVIFSVWKRITAVELALHLRSNFLYSIQS
jgi:hypothetical protein